MSIEHERTLCAQVFLDPTILDASDVVADDFADPICHAIWKAATELHNAGTGIDVIAVRDKDSRINHETLAIITDSAYSAGNWPYYAREVVKASNGRKLYTIGKALAQESKDDPDLAAANAERALLEMSSRGKKYDIVSPQGYISTFMDYIRASHARNGIPGIATGFGYLDESFGGFQARRLYVIGGRPSDGKSALLLNFATHCGIKGKIHVGMISAESAREEIYTRLYASLGKMDGRHLVRGPFSKDDQYKIMSITSDLTDANSIHLWDKPNPQFREVVSVSRHMKAAMGVKAIFVDYLQLIRWQGLSDRTEIAGNVSMGLKALARELDIPVIVAAQLRRDDEGKRPHLGSFQWASQLEQDADVAILIYHQNKGQVDEESELIIAKARDGRTGAMPVFFKRDQVTYYARER